MSIYWVHPAAWRGVAVLFALQFPRTHVTIGYDSEFAINTTQAFGNTATSPVAHTAQTLLGILQTVSSVMFEHTLAHQGHRVMRRPMRPPVDKQVAPGRYAASLRQLVG